MDETETGNGAETTADGRAEHLRWCKDRALAYADRGETRYAINSLIQDLARHPGTAGSVSVVTELMFPLALMGDFERPGALREFIEGFG